METVTETPAEKAKRLGVKLFHRPPSVPIETKSKSDPFLEKMKHELLNRVTGVCETCGKEITVLTENGDPCGKGGCPFGEWRM
jgi:hypothetical protein